MHHKLHVVKMQSVNISQTRCHNVADANSRNPFHPLATGSLSAKDYSNILYENVIPI